MKQPSAVSSLKREPCVSSARVKPATCCTSTDTERKPFDLVLRGAEAGDVISLPKAVEDLRKPLRVLHARLITSVN